MKGSGSWDNDSQDLSSEGKEDDPRAPKTRQENLPIINRAPKARHKDGVVTYKPAHWGGGLHSWTPYGVDGKARATKTRQEEEATARGQAEWDAKFTHAAHQGSGIHSHQGLPALFDPMAMCDSPMGRN